jgi:hypothetical protein
MTIIFIYTSGHVKRDVFGQSVAYAGFVTESVRERGRGKRKLQVQKTLKLRREILLRQYPYQVAR